MYSVTRTRPFPGSKFPDERMCVAGGVAVAEVGMAAVKALREQTGAGIMDCKEALVRADGDVAKAVDWLRAKGLASAAKKASRQATEGLIVSYIHTGGRVGVLLELNCETDFVARTDAFAALGRDLALQIAAMSPEWVRREDVPDQAVESLRAELEKEAAASGKPPAIVERIVEGRLAKFYQEKCLLEQAFIRDEDQTVDVLIRGVIARVGENIVPRRFTRFQLGEAAGDRGGSFE